MSSRISSGTSTSASLSSSLSKKRKKKACSTPIGKKQCLINSISLSEINSRSSTTASDNRTHPEKKRRAKLRLKKLDSIATRAKRTTRYHLRNYHEKSESEWETKSEESANDDAKSRESASSSSSTSSWTLSRRRRKKRKKKPQPLSDDSSNNKSLKLFESPEQTRDATFIRDREGSSPLRRPRTHLDNDELQKHELEGEELLTLPAVIPSILADDDVEISNPSFDSSRVTKTYMPKKKSRKTTVADERATWITKIRLPIASSNMLWDAFVKKNLEDFSQNRTAISPGTSKWNVNRKTDSNSDTSLKLNLKNKHRCDILKLQGMKSVRGYCNASTRKWIDVKCDACDAENEYTNFDDNEEDVKNIRFNDFHRFMLSKNASIKKNVRNSVENQRIGASSKSSNELPCEDTSTNQEMYNCREKLGRGRNPKMLSTTETRKSKSKLLSSIKLNKIRYKKVNKDWEIKKK